MPPPKLAAAPAPAPASATAAASAPASSQGVVVHSSFPASHAIIANIITDSGGSGLRTLSVRAHGLSGTIASIADPGVDLAVSAGELVFSAGSMTLRVTGSFALDPASTKAGFKKKTGVLSVDVQLVE